MSRQKAAAIALASIVLPLPALADDNVLNFVQDGNTHSASIAQTGLGNFGGDDTFQMLQTGFDNKLVLTQSGNANSVGLFGDGFVQTGTPSTDASPANSADIFQNSTGNAIGELVQTTFGVHATTGNDLSVTQDLEDDNTILSIVQITNSGASSNRASIRQTGTLNWIEAINQTTTSADGNNKITIQISGSYNGINGTTDGVGPLKVLGASTNATPGQFIQGSDISGGSHNEIWLTITGDYNQYGMSQYGVDNSVGTLTITGLGNSVGTYQLGRGNQVNPGGIVGDGNDLGVRQVGEDNVADVNILGDSSNNEVGIGQDGDDSDAFVAITGDLNVTGISQLGNRHFASITIGGGENVILGIQANEGLTASQGNSLTVAINGSGNNGLLGGVPQSFTGVTLDALSSLPLIPDSLILAPDASLFTTLAGKVSLVPGTLVQWGQSNIMNINVGTTMVSNDNLFAVIQTGSRGTVSATVNGQGNQFVVLQLNDDDVASIVQSGTNNVAAIIH